MMGDAALALCGEAEGLDLVQLGEKMDCGGPTSSHAVPMGWSVTGWRQPLHSGVWREDERWWA